MGASRSVAVAIYLLGRLFRSFDYAMWYEVVQKQRPFVNGSLTLHRQVMEAWEPFRNGGGTGLSKISPL